LRRRNKIEDGMNHALGTTEKEETFKENCCVSVRAENPKPGVFFLRELAEEPSRVKLFWENNQDCLPEGPAKRGTREGGLILLGEGMHWRGTQKEEITEL